MFLLGHGVENPADGIHGDEGISTSSSCRPEPVRRAVPSGPSRCGGHSAFPRWDGPIEEAFERASWQFHGPRQQALEEIVAEPG